MVTMDFVNACTVMLDDLTAPAKRIQGTALEIMGIGVLSGVIQVLEKVRLL